jgi:isocitrate/isopropylmalate dehydrogenase
MNQVGNLFFCPRRDRPEDHGEVERRRLARDRHWLGIECSATTSRARPKDAHGVPLSETRTITAKAADAVVFGAVGGPRYDQLLRS